MPKNNNFNDLNANPYEEGNNATEQPITALNSVINNPQEVVIALIYNLLMREIGYGEMERGTGINKAFFFRMKTREWFPKKEARQQEIIKKLLKFYNEKTKSE